MKNVIRAAIATAAVLGVMLAAICAAPAAIEDAFILEQELPQEAAMETAHEITDRAETTALEAAEGEYLELVRVTFIESYEDADTIVCETEDGELFAFNGGGYSVGEVLMLTLSDSGTPEDVLDDTIQDVSQAYEVVTI